MPSQSPSKCRHHSTNHGPWALSKGCHSARLTNLYKKWFRQAQPPKKINLKWRSLSPVEGPSQCQFYESLWKWFRQAQPPSRSAATEPVKRIFIKNGFDRLNHRKELIGEWRSLSPVEGPSQCPFNESLWKMVSTGSTTESKGRHWTRQKDLYKKWFRQAQPPKRIK